MSDRAWTEDCDYCENGERLGEVGECGACSRAAGPYHCGEGFVFRVTPTGESVTAFDLGDGATNLDWSVAFNATHARAFALGKAEAVRSFLTPEQIEALRKFDVPMQADVPRDTDVMALSQLGLLTVSFTQQSVYSRTALGDSVLERIDELRGPAPATPGVAGEFKFTEAYPDGGITFKTPDGERHGEILCDLEGSGFSSLRGMALAEWAFALGASTRTPAEPAQAGGANQTNPPDALKQETDWRDIESAPKDGTLIEVSWLDLELGEAQWLDGDWCIVRNAGFEKPTHWRPRAKT